MKQIEKNKEILIKYGISEKDAQLLTEKGYTKSKIEKSTKKDLLKEFDKDFVDEIKQKTKRQPIPDEIFNRLVKETELHCPFCWNLEEEKPIIIHHIDPYSETQDNSFNNLIVLCLNHHADVHTSRQISKNNYPKSRLLYKKEEWIEALSEFKKGNRAAPGKETKIASIAPDICIKQNIDGETQEAIIKEKTEEIFTSFFDFITEEIKELYQLIKLSNVKKEYNQEQASNSVCPG